MKRFLVLAVLVSCGGPAVPARTPEQRAEASAAAVPALQTSKFEDAAQHDLSNLFRRQDAATFEQVLRGVLQNGYQTAMRPSPLVGRLRQRKQQLDRDEDTFERKLRYLFWLN